MHIHTHILLVYVCISYMYVYMIKTCMVKICVQLNAKAFITIVLRVYLFVFT